jgi:hypothetical protein
MPFGYEPWSRDASSVVVPPTTALAGLGGAGDEALREIAELLGHDRPLDDLQPALLKAFRY